MAAQQPTCVLTPKQHEANELLGGPARNIALWGGSRSGKTFLIVRAICMRALSVGGSRHLITRYRKNAVVASVGRDTLPQSHGPLLPGRALQDRSVGMVRHLPKQEPDFPP